MSTGGEQSMPTGKSCEKIRGDLEAYALEVLEPAVRAQVQDHLVSCSTCAAEVDGLRRAVQSLASSAPSRAPRAGLWDRVQRRVEGGETPDEDGVSIFDTAVRAALLKRAEAQDWVPTPFPGIRAKPVMQDAETNRWTLLVEMEPDADFPAHDHRDVERLILLDGDLCFVDRRMERGDRVLMEAGTRHGAATTGAGCRLLYEGSRSDWAPA